MDEKKEDPYKDLKICQTYDPPRRDPPLFSVPAFGSYSMQSAISIATTEGTWRATVPEKPETRVQYPVQTSESKILEDRILDLQSNLVEFFQDVLEVQSKSIHLLSITYLSSTLVGFAYMCARKDGSGTSVMDAAFGSAIKRTLDEINAGHLFDKVVPGFQVFFKSYLQLLWAGLAGEVVNETDPYRVLAIDSYKQVVEGPSADEGVVFMLQRMLLSVMAGNADFMRNELGYR